MAPSRRSARHAPPAAAPAALPPSEPQVLEELNDKDSFRYFNTGWLLPPGTRRGNRPRPPPPPPKPTRKRQKRTPRRGDDSSSLSELSDTEAR